MEFSHRGCILRQIERGRVMNKKILSIITALVFILQGLSAFAAAPAITILSPSKGEIVASDSLVLAASASDADEVRFYLDGVEVARFEGSGDFEYVCEKASYGNHIFRAVALARGETARETQNSFSIRDFSESEVKNLNCNDFDGASISTSGFARFQQNIDTTGTPNGKLGLGKGPDGSGCIMLQGAKKNNTNIYLPFINFALPSTNPDKYTIEHDVFVSDDGMRLSYEFAGVFNIIMDSSVGSFVLEPQKWYKIKSIFDFNAGTYEVYVDGELQSSGSAGALSKTEVRVCWASRKSEDGYLLLDNFVVNRSIATPVVSKMEYLKDDVWNNFTAELPLGTKQVKLYLDGALTPASKDTFAFFQNGEETATNYEFTSDGAILVTFVDDLTPKASCIAEYTSGQFSGKFTASLRLVTRLYM